MFTSRFKPRIVFQFPISAVSLGLGLLLTITMDAQQLLRKRLACAEQGLLSALELGETQLSSYNSLWSTLVDDVSLGSKDLTHDTLDIANVVASRVSVVAECFVDMYRTHEELTGHFQADIQRILHQTTELERQPRSPSRLDESVPPFIAPAYRWLLANLHNPYPSSDVKSSISCTSGYPQSSIDSWFTSARRRMGWTIICREYFRGCRSEAVDAAYRVFVKEDPKRPASSEVVQEFITMKVTAEGLYAATFNKSPLAGDLDNVVKDMTEDDRKILLEDKRRKAEEEEKGKTEKKGLKKAHRASNWTFHDAPQSYRSPVQSGSGSPIPPIPVLEASLPDDSESESDGEIVPPCLAGHKRLSVEEANHDRDLRSGKRLR